MARTKIIEAAINYTNIDNCAYFSSNERKWINRVYNLKRKFPDLVDIQQVPDRNGGYIMAGVPKEWFKLTPPKKSGKNSPFARHNEGHGTNTLPTP